VINSNKLAFTNFFSATLQSDPGPATNLENSHSGLQIKKINSPRVPFPVGRPVGHNPTGKNAQCPFRLSELTDDLAAERLLSHV
jgi:hypothetical protein